MMSYKSTSVVCGSIRAKVFRDAKNTIDHFIVMCLVAWHLNESEARGDLVLIETLLLFLC